MSEYDNQPIHKYKVGDTYMHGCYEVKIVELLDSEFKGQPMYMTQVGNNKPCMTVEGFIDHCMGVEYGVSFIASAPDELKVGDMVEVVDKGYVSDMYIGKVGKVKTIPIDGNVFVDFGDMSLSISSSALRKINIEPDNDSDNVKAFKAILNEMAETYRAKDADYGSAYDDGYRLFGHTQLLSRIYEKFSRVKHLLDGNKQNVEENVCDTLTDMAVQAICLRMLLQKNDFENVV